MSMIFSSLQIRGRLSCGRVHVHRAVDTTVPDFNALGVIPVYLRSDQKRTQIIARGHIKRLESLPHKSLQNYTIVKYLSFQRPIFVTLLFMFSESAQASFPNLGHLQEH